MPTKSRNPAASGKANGAGIERDNTHDAAAQQDAQGANYQPERVRASSAKEWRTAGRIAIATARRATIAGKSDLTYLDFIVLVALSEWLDRDALCFRSLQDLADDCGCSVAAVKGAIKRLIAAGLLEVPVGIRKIARKPGGKVSDRGRPANTYRALIPPNFSNRGSQKEGRFSATCAAENDGGLDSNFGNRGSIPFGNHGCHHVENRTEGGRALGRASANSRVGVVDDVVFVGDEEDQTQEQKRVGSALEGPPDASAAIPSAADTNIAAEPNLAVDHEGPASDWLSSVDDFDEEDVTINALCAARDAVIATYDDFPIIPQMSGAEFAARWPDEWTASDGGNENFRDECANGAAAAWREALAQGGSEYAKEWWRGHREALAAYAAASGFDSQAVQDAVGRYSRAIGRADAARRARA